MSCGSVIHLYKDFLPSSPSPPLTLINLWNCFLSAVLFCVSIGLQTLLKNTKHLVPGCDASAVPWGGEIGGGWGPVAAAELQPCPGTALRRLDRGAVEMAQPRWQALGLKRKKE